jgi:hypothetical protein
MWRNLQRHKAIVSGGKVNWLIDRRRGERLPAIDLRMLIWPEASSAQNNMAAVSAEGSTAWVLIRRLKSSCSRSIAFVEDRPLCEAREDEIAHSMRRPLANTLVRFFPRAAHRYIERAAIPHHRSD